MDGLYMCLCVEWRCQMSLRRLTWSFTSDKAVKALQSVLVFSPQKITSMLKNKEKWNWKIWSKQAQTLHCLQMCLMWKHCKMLTLTQVSMIRTMFPKSPHVLAVTIQCVHRNVAMTAEPYYPWSLFSGLKAQLISKMLTGSYRCTLMIGQC